MTIRTTTALSPTGWLAALLDAIGSQPAGGKVRQCPAHPDSSPSFSVDAGRDGRALLRCFAGCSLAHILKTLRLHQDTLTQTPSFTPAEHAARLRIEFPPVTHTGHPAGRGCRLEATHDYGEHYLERWRSPSGAKDLLWFTRTANGDVPGLLGRRTTDLPLYRELEVRAGMALGELVLLVESESSVDALRGWYATTWAGSATVVPVGRLYYVLGGYDRLVVIPDNDDAGLRCLDRLARFGLARYVLWPAKGEDARDLYRRLDTAAFRAVVDGALGVER
jgi:hypothetical protein